MKTSLLLSTVVLLAAACARAELVPLSADASLEFEVFGDTSPSPACLTQWSLHVGPGEVIHYGEARTDYPCQSDWLVHAGADSLLCRTSWPELDPTDYVWNRQTYSVHVTMDIDLTERTRFHVSRQMTGQLHEGIQSIRWTDLDGGTVEAPSMKQDEGIQLDLDPGRYWLAVEVWVVEVDTHYAYSNSIRVTWEDAPLVATRDTTWGAVRTLFR